MDGSRRASLARASFGDAIRGVLRTSAPRGMPPLVDLALAWPDCRIHAPRTMSDGFRQSLRQRAERHRATCHARSKARLSADHCGFTGDAKGRERFNSERASRSARSAALARRLGPSPTSGRAAREAPLRVFRASERDRPPLIAGACEVICGDDSLFCGGAAHFCTSGGEISHRRGLHFDVSVSFLNCELITNSCVR